MTCLWIVGGIWIASAVLVVLLFIFDSKECPEELSDLF